MGNIKKREVKYRKEDINETLENGIRSTTFIWDVVWL